MSIFDKYDGNDGSEIHRAEQDDYSYADPQTVEENVVEAPKYLRIIPHAVYSCFIVAVLFLRLANVQIAQGKANAYLAKEHSVRQIIQPVARGTIMDSRGLWLARNTSSFQVQLNPRDLPRKQSDRAKVYEATGVVLKWSDADLKNYANEIESKLKVFRLDPVVLQENVAHDDALQLIQKLDALPAISVVATNIRQYNKPELGLAHVLGYVGKVSDKDLENESLHRSDVIGKTGLESSYDKDLRGINSVIEAVVNSKGKVLHTLTDASNFGVPGSNVVLNIDAKLQQISQDALQEGLKKAGLQTGVVVAMDPRNGAIRALVSYPAYDNNQFSGGIPQDLYQKLTEDSVKPLFNRVTQGIYPPGSTIKPFIAAIGLDLGVITEKTRVDTPPEIQIGQQIFPNWQKEFLYNIDVKTAIAKSNDIFFYWLGGGGDKIKGIGVEKLAQGLPNFGFDQKTGIDIPGENTGLVPTPDWKKKYKKESWFIGDTYHMAIGQGDLLVTPLQLVNALSVVANGGTLYKPHVVQKIVDQEGKTIRTIEPEVIRDHMVNDDAMRVVREGMRQAVTDGSGRQLQDLPVTSGAKTGTAQIGANNEFLHSWFEAFAPYDNPEIAIVVLGEKGSQENEGNTTAEPIAHEILKQYFSEDFKK